MTWLNAALREARSTSPMRMAFLKWQCRTRQMAMRDGAGRPDGSMTPALYIDDAAEPLGHVITVLNKSPGHSVTPELKHILARTNDPAQRREQALRFFSAGYYQRPAEFSDILTATFPPDSPGAARIRAAGEVRLAFDAFAQRFDLACRVWRLAAHNPLHEATMAHNALFNPALSPQAEVLGFEPDWTRCISVPALR